MEHIFGRFKAVSAKTIQYLTLQLSMHWSKAPQFFWIYQSCPRDQCHSFSPLIYFIKNVMRIAENYSVDAVAAKIMISLFTL